MPTPPAPRTTGTWQTARSVPQLLSVASAAELLDCSRGHVYGLIAAGELAAVDLAAKGRKSKTRVLASEIEDLIRRRTRRLGAPEPAWPAVLPQPRSDLYPHHAVVPPKDRATYGTPEAAERAQVPLAVVTAAVTSGDLHVHRRGDRGPWQVDHGCLLAWLSGELCTHREEGGNEEVRRR